jgi:hypothetical protein
VGQSLATRRAAIVDGQCEWWASAFESTAARRSSVFIALVTRLDLAVGHLRF